MCGGTRNVLAERIKALLPGTKLFGIKLNVIRRGDYGKGRSLGLGGKGSQFRKTCLVSGQSY